MIKQKGDKYSTMKAIVVLVVGILVSACGLNSQCAINGANIGYMVGAFKTNNVVMANMYSVAGRIHGSRYCD